MRNVLFLAHRVPFPPDRGDKIRGYHLLKHLSRGARVHLVAFADEPRDLHHDAALAKISASHAVIWRGKRQLIAAAQALLSGRPISLTAFDDAAMRRAVADVMARQPIDAIVVFSSQMAQYLPEVPPRPIVMDFVDMDSAKFADYAANSRGPMAWMLAREGRLLFAHERAVADRADASLFVSDAEAALFRARSGAERVCVVENGIDTNRFDPRASFEPVDAAGPLIVFTGQMDYRPNVEGVTWFANDMLAPIRARHPTARFAIVGRAPTDAVHALARRPGVIVTGEVADVRGWLAAAAVVVAPLKQARGIQNKVLEAMAMARPVVASTAAAEGIDHDGAIRVTHTADAMSSSVSDLLGNIEVARGLGTAGRARVLTRYGWDARLAPLDALLGLPLPHPALVAA